MMLSRYPLATAVPRSRSKFLPLDLLGEPKLRAGEPTPREINGIRRPSAAIVLVPVVLLLIQGEAMDLAVPHGPVGFWNVLV